MTNWTLRALGVSGAAGQVQAAEAQGRHALGGGAVAHHRVPHGVRASLRQRQRVAFFGGGVATDLIRISTSLAKRGC
jgi:hypothetical protein